MMREYGCMVIYHIKNIVVLHMRVEHTTPAILQKFQNSYHLP